MPRVEDGLERKTPEELEALAKDAKGEFVKGKAGRPKKLVTEGVAPLDSNAAEPKVVGSLQPSVVKQDSAMAKVFQKIESSRKGWIKMSDEEVADYQAQGILIGHDPVQGIGLLRKD